MVLVGSVGRELAQIYISSGMMVKAVSISKTWIIYNNLHCTTSQKTVNFILVTVRTWHLI